MNNNYDNKINFYNCVIENIYQGINKYKLLNIITTNDYNNCIESLEKVINLLSTISDDNILNDLQYINNNLSTIIKNYGIYNFEYLLKICLGFNFIEKYILNNNKYQIIYELFKKYIHPISYKILNWNNKKNKNIIPKEIQKNKIIDDKIILEDSDMFECFDLMRVTTNFNLRVNGIKIIIHDIDSNKTLIVNCICDNILINNIKYKFLTQKYNDLLDYLNINNFKNNDTYDEECWVNYTNILNLKDYLIYSNFELINKYIYIMTQNLNNEQKPINSIVQDFISNDLFGQRTLLIQLLLNTKKQEFQYISYLLYDLLSSDSSNSYDSDNQKMLYESLPWQCKKIFKNAMYSTIEYTNKLSNIDNNKIPLEQQICLMKVNDNVKEKAMQKLKEIKSKSEDSGSKARQYLDGLLKIPFGIYKEEYILKKHNEIINSFNNLNEVLNIINVDNIEVIEIKEFIAYTKENIVNKKYNSLEIMNIIKKIEEKSNSIYFTIFNYILNMINNKKKSLLYIIESTNIINKKYNLIQLNNKGTINELKKEIILFLENNKENTNLLKEIIILFESIDKKNITNNLLKIEKYILKINSKNNEIVNYIGSLNKTLDNAVHGHKNAKIQIERLIGQWINGEKTGYCFGFEGPPGIGKTSLAKKGIAKCLKDINDESRPFSFIALGGSSNGSILDGHNYTYVGSTWGKIVDILIEHKCMNPIIFIDELDKVSRTEHGREIIGILTHLIDSTQNNSFQDKYFSNIDLDLSKVLFIFSYNDVDLIDRILLDRIHRIKFDNLYIEDKLIITNKYLLPELYKNFGIENIILIDDNTIKYLIEYYTNEPGVRKLKEILFEIISSINLDLLKNKNNFTIPLTITIELIENILKDKHKIKILQINDENRVGLINGLWANAYGNGGMLNIEASFFLTSTFLDLKLTGMQGDVMKESMAVSKTLALSLINNDLLESLIIDFEKTKKQGIHIHVPEGATPKDGPSAGAAITLVIYSLLTNKKIKNNFAITGEICLRGNITAIGGLELKVLGGLKSGITNFIYPEDNLKDFNLLYEKHLTLLEKCNFYKVNHINEVLDLMLEEK